METVIIILIFIAGVIYWILRDGKREANKRPLNAEVDEHSPENIAFEEALKRIKSRNEINEL